MLHFVNIVAARKNRPAMFRKKPDKADLEQRAEMCALAVALCTELQTQVPITSDVLSAECATQQQIQNTGTQPCDIMMKYPPNHTVMADQHNNNFDPQCTGITPTTPNNPYPHHHIT
jgi:hypothetical protein